MLLCFCQVLRAVFLRFVLPVAVEEGKGNASRAASELSPFQNNTKQSVPSDEGFRASAVVSRLQVSNHKRLCGGGDRGKS